MAQTNLITLKSEGDDKGVGQSHVYYTFKNRKQNPDKLRLRKYNPVARTHTWYVETKKL